jgi:hypothetical protein
MRTQPDILFTINELQKLKEVLPPLTLLDEDVHQAIDAQITTLEHKLNEADIWHNWPAGNEDAFNRDRAFLALHWLQDEESPNPIVGWLKMMGGEQV